MIEWDIAIFEWINQSATNGLLDAVLPPIRDGGFWLPLYFLLFILALIRYKWKAFVWLAFCFITVGVSDGTTNYALKKQIQRLRPCHADSPVEARLLIKCGSGYSMSSAHASNHMALAIFFAFSLFYGHALAVAILLFWAISIGYAQIYVGVHYPLDIIVGFTVGVLAGNLGLFLWRKTARKLWGDGFKP
ncbi:MAG: phosphatase PAP2 family protein [Bacteroidetes bacterium]|jgi:undecaprenyl-diphosphatase|nr:phosphatase PAP2 family protein [Bacteroidota bacterium]